MSSEKFLLAVIPSADVVSYVDTFRRQYAKNTSYIIAPHITVCPPFYCNDSKSHLIHKLKETFTKTAPFRVSFTSVGFFIGGNNVAFFKPDSDSATKLRNLLRTSQLYLSELITNVWPDYPTDPECFTPHCTIAEHVPDIEFLKVRQDLESLSVSQSFDVNSLFLLKKQQENWLSISEISFWLTVC